MKCLRRLQWNRLAVMVPIVLMLIACQGGGNVAVGAGGGQGYQESGGPPPWAPAHGHRAKHKYRYYPEMEVYFDTGRSLWFYLDAGDWRISAELPSRYQVGNDCVMLEMDADRPYRYHSDVAKRYPRGQAKKGGGAPGKEPGKEPGEQPGQGHGQGHGQGQGKGQEKPKNW